MNIDWTIVMYLYFTGAIISFLTYFIWDINTNDNDIEINIFKIIGVLLICIFIWWLEVLLQIMVRVCRFLSKPIIKKRKIT